MGPEPRVSGGEAASGAYTAQWLKERVATGRAVTPVLESGATRAAHELTPAAVLVPVIDRSEGLMVLFTQRTAHLYDHPGQVAFPGGRMEASDDSPVVTALREAREEIGLEPSQLGTLPDYHTGTGFRVTPVIGLVNPPLSLQVDEFEVAAVFEAPLDFLLDPANHQRHSAEIRGALRHYYAMPYQGFFIWGATAGMVVSLYRHLFSL
jgi:8-oxo-dGTP pyrophosphatase MutT (NUDIX family)